MSYERLAYADQDSTLQMSFDCAACAGDQRFSRKVRLTPALGEPPTLAFEEFRQDLPKPVITVSDAAAHLAARLHLHLD